MFGNAEAYDQFMGRWSRVVAPLLVDFAGVPDAGRMLDVGSGIGTLAFEIAKHKGGRHVIGIDPSKEFVAYAMSRNPFPDQTRFHVGDAQDLHFADATFVAGLSLLVFNFIPHPEKALREGDRLQMLRSALKRQLGLSSESEACALPARVWAVRGDVPADR
jgi:ubiquinone/menaquinone biosynthesis C-methylase UbiE